jgi:polyisoprenoid-binding protein YceI
MHPFAKKIAAGFRAETAVDRRDFGITWNAAMDTGGAHLGERVHISLSISALLQ